MCHFSLKKFMHIKIMWAYSTVFNKYYALFSTTMKYEIYLSCKFTGFIFGQSSWLPLKWTSLWELNPITSNSMIGSQDTLPLGSIVIGAFQYIGVLWNTIGNLLRFLGTSSAVFFQNLPTGTAVLVQIFSHKAFPNIPGFNNCHFYVLLF